MRIVRTVAGLRHALNEERRAGRRIGFVPTMGAFHDGHLSLMRRARAECSVVVVSLFVNPTQFGDPADLAAYPRDDARDEKLARVESVDILFMPPVGEMYPPGFATTIDVRGVTESLEGEARGAAHFRGMATVVTKLLQMVQPEVAYFGQKDAQQAVVVRRLTRDLDIPVHIEVCPIIREPDGLAMSSRNVRLSADARARALGLSAALRSVEQRVAAGERSAGALAAHARAVLATHGISATDVEYFSLVNPETLVPVDAVAAPTLIAVAGRVDGVRLIDNVIVRAG